MDIDKVLKIKNMLEKNLKQLKYKESMLQQKQLQQKLREERKNKNHTVSESVETLKVASSAPTVCSSEIAPAIKETECDLLSLLRKKINEVNVALRQYGQGRFNQVNKDILIELCNSLESLYVRLKQKGLTIGKKDQCHYDKAVALVKSMKE